jgi:hypothetical protein
MFQYACRTVEKMDMIFIYQETKIATDKTYLTISDIDMGVNENITNNTFQKDHRTQKYNPEIFNISDNTLIWGILPNR